MAVVDGWPPLCWTVVSGTHQHTPLHLVGPGGEALAPAFVPLVLLELASAARVPDPEAGAALIACSIGAIHFREGRNIAALPPSPHDPGDHGGRVPAEQAASYSGRAPEVPGRPALTGRDQDVEE